MEIIYSSKAQGDILYWKKSGDKKAMNRISELISSIETNPYVGIGKPELLKHNLSGCWSRRINKEHRIVYRVASIDLVEIVSIRFHY